MARRLTWWIGALATLTLIRVGIPLVALAGGHLPDTPRVESRALSGDATGFYAASREFIAAWGRLPRPAFALLMLATVAGAGLLIRTWRTRPALRPWLVVGAALWVSVVLVVNLLEQQFSGAAVVGWSIVWAIPMLPVRAVGATLDQNVAFWLGLPLQLACNAVTVIATAYAAFFATGRRVVGIVAAAAFTVWPLLTGAIAGHEAWQNATWDVDVGIHMYTEPLSTALVAVALALLLSPKLTPMRLGLAGSALSYAVAVKLSNVVAAGAAGCVLGWRWRSELQRVIPFVAGALAFLPVVLAYWPLGYTKLHERPGYWHSHPFSASYIVTSWTRSLVFTPHTLAIIVPLALVGIAAVRRPWPLSILAIWTLANPIFYSFFWYTKIHPRFMWASLPSFFVFWAAGVMVVGRVASSAARTVPRGEPTPP